MLAVNARVNQMQMVAAEGVEPVLVGTSIKGVVLDALSEITVTQTYRNDEQQTIEAVYTFPLPLDAVLLDLNIRLGNKEYQGQVLARQSAEKVYEKTVANGDTAIMLESPQPGIYTMNVGNLLPGDECVIAYRYGMFHYWQGQSLRICLPTVIAPRYGNPAAGNFQPHQTPVTEILAEHTLDLRLQVKGAIASARITSPSHAVTLTHGNNSVTVDLAKEAWLDRDFILEIIAPSALPVFGYYAKDGSRNLVWVPFHPEFAPSQDRQPLAITVVVDCSGSMQGDSIAQAREALLRIVDALHPQYYFGLVLFGSTHKSFADQLLPANAKNLATLRQHIMTIGADMGGTELASALKAAYALKGPKKMPADVLLITDGQVSDWREIAREAKQSGQRVFTVGVGSAVTESAVREIAGKSGGACELVSPREDMAGRIYRHFLRLQAQRSLSAAVSWDKTVNVLWPNSIDRLYSGDTLHQCAWFSGEPANFSCLTVALPDGGSYEQKVELHPLPQELGSDTLPRLVAGYRLRDGQSDEAGEKLALEYRLISPWTNYCVAIKREGSEERTGMPVLRQVPQMMPAGWHGAGTVAIGAIASVCDSISFDSKRMADIPVFMRSKRLSTSGYDTQLHDDLLLRRLRSLQEDDLRSLLRGGLRVRDKSIAGLSKEELVLLCSKELRAAAGSTVRNLFREDHEFAYKQLLIDVADKLTDGFTWRSWTEYAFDDAHTEQEIETEIIEMFDKKAQKWWNGLSEKEKHKLAKDLGAVLNGDKTLPSKIREKLKVIGIQQLIDNAIQSGVTYGLSKVAAHGMLGALGMSIVSHIGWLILVQTVGVMGGLKIAVFGLGGFGAFGGAVTTLGAAAVGVGVSLPLTAAVLDGPAYRKTIPTVIMLLAKCRQQSAMRELQRLEESR